VKVSARLGTIAPSATMAIDARQKAMRRSGLPVISFGAGEPDFPTPEPIAQAGVSAIDSGYTKYTAVNGIPELREAIAARLVSDVGLHYAPEQITVTNGAKEAAYLALQALVNPGDEVIIPGPYWVSYEAQVLLAGGKPVVLPATEEDEFKLAPARLARALTGRLASCCSIRPATPPAPCIRRMSCARLAGCL